MQTTTLSFSNLHNHGDLFANLFRARRQSFIVQKNWDLPQADGMEYDQYDNPASRWVAVHDGENHVLGGFRLTPTTAQCGIYSYMIRDARGILGGSIPQDLLFGEAPVDPHVRECTRVFVNHATPMSIRRRVHMTMAGAMTRAARELGATQLVALTDAKWPRWYGRCGVEAEAIGRVMWIDDGDFQCVSINLANKMH